METVYSKRHPVNFYLQLIFPLSLGFGTGIFFIVMGLIKKKFPGANGGKDILILFGLIIIFITIYFIYRFIKNTPSIILNDNSITFGNVQYFTKDIETIQYTGKQAFKGSHIKQEGMKISFRNGESLCILDNLYSNGYIMKQHIQFMMNPEGKSFMPAKIDRIESSTSGNFITYRGMLLTNFRMLLIFGFTIFPLFMMEKDNDKWPILFFPAFFFLLLSFWSFNYFELNDKHFRIKSQLQFWKNITYPTDDILEVVMQPNGRAPHSLTLILKDFSTRTYTAASLNSDNWRELQSALEKKNITVRNNLI